jgi:hypothetical protein
MQSIRAIAKIATPRASIWSIAGPLPNPRTLVALKMRSPNNVKPLAEEMSMDKLGVFYYINIWLDGQPNINKPDTCN